MPLGLKRYQTEGDDHFITFSCYNREPWLNTSAARDTFLHSLELTRARSNFDVLGYVVMPEHIHLLVSEPPEIALSKALHSLKLSASKRLTQRPFWQTRYYDFNVFNRDKASGKTEVHAPQSGHSRTRRKARGLAVVQLSPLSSERTHTCKDHIVHVTHKSGAPSSARFHRD